MPTATQNTAATGVTSKSLRRTALRQHFRLNHSPSVFNRADELISVEQKKGHTAKVALVTATFTDGPIEGTAKESAVPLFQARQLTGMGQILAR
jgi:hypothetical protein